MEVKAVLRIAYSNKKPAKATLNEPNPGASNVRTNPGKMGQRRIFWLFLIWFRLLSQNEPEHLIQADSGTK